MKEINEFDENGNQINGEEEDKVSQDSIYVEAAKKELNIKEQKA